MIIKTLAFKRTGYLQTQLIEAIVGTDIYSENEDHVYTALEVYQSLQCPGITIVQSRSLVIQGYGVAFSKQLSEWIQSVEFRSVFLVTGVDNTRRNDQQLNSSPLRYLSLKPIAEWKDKFSQLGWKEMEPIDGSFAPYPIYIPPGGGLTNLLIGELKNMNLLVITWFTEAGGNIYLNQTIQSHPNYYVIS